MSGPDDASLARSRRHHPAGAQGEVVAATVHPFADALARRGVAHPTVGAATLAVRGAQGRSRSSFAAAYGLDEAHVVVLESGHASISELPAPLRWLTPVVALDAALRRIPDSATPEYGPRTGQRKGI